MKISICIPVYNAEASIARLVETVRAELAGHALEFVLVNDGSRDRSDEVCLELARRFPSEVTYVLLRRNSGEHNAVMCALNHMTGDYAVIIDDDFQNPPEEILTLVRMAEKGFDVVYSRYAEKQHSAFRNLGSRFNDRVATWLLEKPSDLYLSSFKLIRAEVVREIIKYTGPFPYVDGLIFRVTQNVASVLVRHEARREGRSNYTLKKLVSLWLNMFINFSVKPLRLFTVIGMVTAALSLVFIIWVIADKFLRPEQNYGWPSIIVTISFFSGLQLCFLGLIAEYLGKQFLMSNGSPQWTIKRVVRAGA